MNIDDIFSSDFLKASDLQGRPHTVTIAGVEPKKFDGCTKLIISFVGKKKSLCANKTNCKRVAFMHGSNTDLWIGKSIVIYPDMVEYQGKTVEAIRVRPPEDTKPATHKAPAYGDAVGF